MRRTGIGAAPHGSRASHANALRNAARAGVAQAIAFLADSERNGFINGVSLPVDGGWISDASWNGLRVGTRR